MYTIEQILQTGKDCELSMIDVRYLAERLAEKYSDTAASLTTAQEGVSAEEAAEKRFPILPKKEWNKTLFNLLGNYDKYVTGIIFQRLTFIEGISYALSLPDTAAPTEVKDSNVEPLFRWVKCSDRMPKIAAEYYVKVDDYKSVGIFDGKNLYANDYILNATEWLEQLPITQPEIKSHNELIKCPQCDINQFATVEHSIPFFTYTHHCGKCGYIICESDWERVIQPEVKPEPVNDWVSIKDGLPEYYKTVQVFDKGLRTSYNAWRASNGDDDYYTVTNSDFILPNPTHWQTLPTPPQPSKEQ